MLGLPPSSLFRSALDPAEGPSATLRRDAMFRRLLILADAAAALVALASALTLGAGGAGALTWASLGVLPLVVLIAKLLGLYDRDELVFHKSTLDEAPSLFYLASLFALVCWLLHDVLVEGPLSRGQTLALWITFFVLTLIGRTLARNVARAASPVERCLVVGPSGARARFAGKLARAQRGTEVAGYLPLADERRTRELEPEAAGVSFERRRADYSVADLERLVERLDVHRVVVIPGNADSETMLDTITRAKAAGVKVSILPRMFEVIGSSVEFDDLEGITVLGVRRFGLSRSSCFIKRVLDVTCSSVGLVLLSPLLGVIALGIKLDSSGPVLFRQPRVGLGSERFEMLKFRSMVEGADRDRDSLEALNESDGLFKIASDPRVTRVGRLLRRSSLDELPQLVNVLRGEMSLVGPRPLVPDEDGQVEGRHRHRLQLTPGMTGAWQLLGPTRVPLGDMVNIDYLYGANWSLWMDIKILLRTVAHVFQRQGL